MRHESDWWIGGFIAAFFIGLALTLVYTWYLVPQTPPTTPANLTQSDKETYLVLVAAAYRHDGDWQKAQARLARLGDKHIAETVATLTRASIDRNADPRDIRSLATLAEALGATESYMLVYLATSTPLPTPTPTVTATPSPTRTPTQTPSPSPTVFATITPRATPTPSGNKQYRVAQSVPLCNPDDAQTMRIYVRDKTGKGIAGAKITVLWNGGENTLYTGFKSTENPGYADFQMAIDQKYQVKLTDIPAEIARNIDTSPQTCSNLPENIAPAWQIVFQQN